MKVFYFFLFLITFHNASLSQETRFNKKDSAKIADVDYIQYNLDSTDKSGLTIKLPFSRISFFDVRYDTSFIAINWQANKNFMFGLNIQNRKFNLTGGLAGSLTNYFDRFYNDNFSRSNAEVVCFIKKFSINLKDTMLDDRKPHGSINNIKFETECYYFVGDSLFPAIRIDTSYSEEITKIKKSFSELIKEIIHPLIERMTGIDSLTMRKRKSYTLQQIQDRYQSRFNLSILTTKEYKKGIYKNFREFINNGPSITEFTVKNAGFNTYLYDADGQIISKVFGFCDGINCWMYGGAFCSPLVRVGNSFEYFYTTYFVGQYMTTTKKYLFALNMENGRVD